MSYRFADHTGEVQLELEAPTVAELFAEAVRALGELLDDGEGRPAPSLQRRSVELEAPDRARLLVDLIDELIFLAEREGMVPVQAEVKVEGNRLSAEVGLAPKPPLPLAKAATLHDLALEEGAGGVATVGNPACYTTDW